MRSVWEGSVLCRDAALEMAKRDALVEREVAEMRRRNVRVWHQRGASVPMELTTGRDLNADWRTDARRRPVTLAVSTRLCRVLQLIAARTQTVDELVRTMDAASDERVAVANTVNKLRMKGWVQEAGWMALPGSGGSVCRMRYEATEAGRKELARAIRTKQERRKGPKARKRRAAAEMEVAA